MQLRTPRTMRIAYLIHCNASAREWNTTTEEIAQEIGEDIHSVRSIVGLKGWGDRLRVSTCRRDDTYTSHSARYMLGYYDF